MERTTALVRHRRVALVVAAVLVLGVLTVLLRDAHVQREAAWAVTCRAQGGWVDTVPGPRNPLLVGSEAPTRTCWSLDGRVLDRRR